MDFVCVRDVWRKKVKFGMLSPFSAPSDGGGDVQRKFPKEKAFPKKKNFRKEKEFVPRTAGDGLFVGFDQVERDFLFGNALVHRALFDITVRIFLGHRKTGDEDPFRAVDKADFVHLFF